MIQFDSRSGDSVLWKSQRENPVVHLDTCALREIAESDELADRFVRAIRSKRGTLSLTWLSIEEFGNFEDRRHANAVANLVDRLNPNLYIQDHRFDEVVRRELSPSSDRNWANDGDFILFDLLVRHLLADGNKLGDVWRMSDVTLLQQQMELRAENQMAYWTETLRKHDAPPVQLRALNERLIRKYAHHQHATASLAYAILHGHLSNTNRAPTTNDVLDLGHTVVPVAYNDFVVLDARWSTIAAQAVQRVRRLGSKASTAKIFGASCTELRRMLDALEAFILVPSQLNIIR